MLRALNLRLMYQPFTLFIFYYRLRYVIPKLSTLHSWTFDQHPSWYRAFPPFFHLLRQFLSPRLLSIISDYMRQHSYKQHLRYKGTECDSRSRQPLWQNSRHVLMYYCGRSSIIVPTRPNNIDSQAGVVSLRPPRSGRQFNAKVVQTDPPSKY